VTQGNTHTSAGAALDELLDRARPSIQYRLRWEVLGDAHWTMWFQRMEMLSRLGVVQALPELARQAVVHGQQDDGNGQGIHERSVAAGGTQARPCLIGLKRMSAIRAMRMLSEHARLAPGG
jgi:hypothetical protein